MSSQTHFWDLGVENFSVSRNLKKMGQFILGLLTYKALSDRCTKGKWLSILHLPKSD